MSISFVNPAYPHISVALQGVDTIWGVLCAVGRASVRDNFLRTYLLLPVSHFSTPWRIEPAGDGAVPSTTTIPPDRPPGIPAPDAAPLLGIPHWMTRHKVHLVSRGNTQDRVNLSLARALSATLHSIPDVLQLRRAIRPIPIPIPNPHPFPNPIWRHVPFPPAFRLELVVLPTYNSISRIVGIILWHLALSSHILLARV